MTEIVAQLFGVIGAIITISSFQFKDNKLYFSAQAAGGLCFAVSDVLLGRNRLGKHRSKLCSALVLILYYAAVYLFAMRLWM